MKKPLKNRAFIVEKFDPSFFWAGLGMYSLDATSKRSGKIDEKLHEEKTSK